MRSTPPRYALLVLVALLAAAGTAHAAPQPWQVWLPPPATPLAVQQHGFMAMLQWLITVVAVFVLVLLAYACFRFREERNPVPSRRSHNTVLEVVWTAAPVLILVIIAIPSFKLLYFSDVIPRTDMTVKAIGRQWYWSYEYPDHGNFTFDAYMIADEELKDGQLRLLETDNRVVVPVDTNVRIQTTSTDVIHSWSVPQFGVKVDAVPGHLNELWFRVTEPGTYHGHCYELCGVNHAFMPITVEAVTKEQFDAWVTQAQQQFARADGAPPAVAEAAAAVPAPASPSTKD
jgi:cytochrome c oxidase subunit 2